MEVIMSDPAIMVTGWLPELDELGVYRKKIRKTPEELKAERNLRRDRGDTRKVNPLRYENRTVITHLYDDQHTAYFLPGLWPRVKAELDNRGIKYTITDNRNPDIRPTPDYSVLDGVSLRKNQDVALAMIVANDCGIINTPTAFGKSYLVSQLCKMYPTLNIVITTSSVSVVETLYRYLCETCPGEVGVKGGGKDRSIGKRIIVCTLKALNTLPAEDVHLLLCDECHNVGDGEAGQAIMRFAFARKFGFSASPVRNDGTHLFMESLFGPELIKMDYQEAVDANMVVPIKYHMMPVNKGPLVCRNDGISEVIFKRYAYWCNSYRNTMVQRLVYDIHDVYKGQILIMVNTLEHAIQLHILLPWFTVLYYGATSMEDLKKKFPKDKYPTLDLSRYKMTKKSLEIGRAAFAKGTLKWVISTKILRQGVNAVNLSVLIRCDGDVSEVDGIQVPGRLARTTDGKENAYLIDCADNFGPQAKRRSDSRKALYDKMQWQEITRKELIDDLRAIGERDTDGDAGHWSSE